MIDDPAIRRVIGELRLVSGLGPDLAAKLVHVLAGISKEESAPADTTLFNKDDPVSDEGYILLDGELSIIKDGSPEITATAPELLGEMARFSPVRQRTATVTAITELKLLRFNWSDFTSAAQAYLTDAELEKVTAAIGEVAWEHFTQ